MKYIITLLAVGLLVASGYNVARADEATTKTYVDGAVLTLHAQCALSDVCASIAMPNGDTIDVLFGKYGQATEHSLLMRNSVSGILLTVIRRHGETVLLSQDQKFYAEHNAAPTGDLPFDGGTVRLHFAWNGDTKTVWVSEVVAQ